MKILNKRNMISSALVSSVLLINGCGGGGGGGGNTPEEKQVTPTTTSYTILAVDDPIIGATVKASECESFEEGTEGYYVLNGCTSKPAAIAVEGGFIDLDGDGQQGDDETSNTTMLLNTAQTNNLTVSPLTTLVANIGTDESLDDIASSLGLTKEDLFKKPSEKEGLEDVLRSINATLIQAKELGVEDTTEFLKDFRSSIKEANANSSSTDTLLDRIKKAQTKIAEKAKEGEYIKKYGVVFSGFVSETNTNSDSTTDLLKSIANKNKVSSNKVVFSGFIYDDIIKNADIKLYYIDPTSGEQKEVGGAEIEDGADDLTDNTDTGKWKITVDETVLDTDQVLIFEGTANVEKDDKSIVQVKLNTAISTVVLRELYKNKINTADLKDITITNVTTAKLSLLKLLDDEILKKPEAIIENKKIIETNPNLKQVLKTTAAAVKAVIDKDATLDVKDGEIETTKDNTQDFANEVAKKLIIKVYGDEVLDETEKNETTEKSGLEDNLNQGITEGTKVSTTTLSTTKKEIEDDKTLSGQLSSTKYVKFKVTSEMLSSKVLKIKFDDNSGKFDLKLFSNNTFIKILDKTNIYVGKWSISDAGNLVLNFTTETTPTTISFSSLGLLAKGSYGTKKFEVQGINTLASTEIAPLVEFTDTYIANNKLYVINDNSVVQLSSTNSSVSNGKLLFNSIEYKIISATNQLISTKDSNGNKLTIYLDKTQADNKNSFNSFLTGVTVNEKTISLSDIYSTNTANKAVLDGEFLKYEVHPISATSLAKSIGNLSYDVVTENTLGAKTVAQVTSINANSSRQRSYLAMDYLLEGCDIGSSRELRVSLQIRHDKVKLIGRYKDSEELIIDEVLVTEPTLNNTYDLALYVKENTLYAYVKSNDINTYFKSVALSSVISDKTVKKLNKFYVGASLYNNEAGNLYESDTLNTPVKGLVKEVSTLVGNDTYKLVSTTQECTTTEVQREGINLTNVPLTTLESPYTFTSGVWGIQTQGNSSNEATLANDIYSLKAISTTDDRSRIKVRINTNEANVIGYQSTLKLISVGDDKDANQRTQMVVGYVATNSSGGKAIMTIGVSLKKRGIYAWTSLYDDVNSVELKSDYLSSTESTLAETTGDFLNQDFTISTWIGSDKKLYININGTEKSFDMSSWDLKGYTLNSYSYKYEANADIRYGSDTTQTVESQVKEVSSIKGTISYIPEAPTETISTLLPTATDWTNSDIEFFKSLDSSKYDLATALDANTFVSKFPLYNLEYQSWDMNPIDVEKSTLELLNDKYVLKTYDKDSSGAFTQLNEDLVGNPQFTIVGNELVSDVTGNHYKLKYLGQVDASSFNSTSKTVFTSGKAYGFVVKVTADSYGFDRKLEKYDETATEPVYYTSFDEFITSHKAPQYFRSYEDDSSTTTNRGIAFASSYTTGATSGNLVEVIDGTEQTAVAGTWKIETNSELGRDILSLSISVSGYDDEDDVVFTVDNGFVYEGWMDKAGEVFGGYFFDETAKDEFEASYAPSATNTFGGESLLNKTIYAVEYVNASPKVVAHSVDGSGTSMDVGVLNSTEVGTSNISVSGNKLYTKDESETSYDSNKYIEYQSGSFSSGCVYSTTVDNGTNGSMLMFEDKDIALNYANQLTSVPTSCPSDLSAYDVINKDLKTNITTLLSDTSSVATVANAKTLVSTIRETADTFLAYDDLDNMLTTTLVGGQKDLIDTKVEPALDAIATDFENSSTAMETSVNEFDASFANDFETILTNIGDRLDSINVLIDTNGKSANWSDISPGGDSVAFTTSTSGDIITQTYSISNSSDNTAISLSVQYDSTITDGFDLTETGNTGSGTLKGNGYEISISEISYTNGKAKLKGTGTITGANSGTIVVNSTDGLDITFDIDKSVESIQAISNISLNVKGEITTGGRSFTGTLVMDESSDNMSLTGVYTGLTNEPSFNGSFTTTTSFANLKDVIEDDDNSNYADSDTPIFNEIVFTNGTKEFVHTIKAKKVTEIAPDLSSFDVYVDMFLVTNNGTYNCKVDIDKNLTCTDTTIQEILSYEGEVITADVNGTNYVYNYASAYNAGPDGNGYDVRYINLDFKGDNAGNFYADSVSNKLTDGTNDITISNIVARDAKTLDEFDGDYAFTGTLMHGSKKVEASYKTKTSSTSNDMDVWIENLNITDGTNSLSADTLKMTMSKAESTSSNVEKLEDRLYALYISSSSNGVTEEDEMEVTAFEVANLSANIKDSDANALTIDADFTSTHNNGANTFDFDGTYSYDGTTFNGKVKGKSNDNTETAAFDVSGTITPKSGFTPFSINTTGNISNNISSGYAMFARGANDEYKMAIYFETSDLDGTFVSISDSNGVKGKGEFSDTKEEFILQAVDGTTLATSGKDSTGNSWSITYSDDSTETIF